MNYKRIINSFKVLTLTFSTLFLLSCEDPQELGGCDFSENLEDYNLVWNDEFESDQIDAATWSYDLGDGCDRGEGLCGWGNNELQDYTDSSANAKIENGVLKITAIKENDTTYTSARLVTKDKKDWRYGRVDVRAKMPIGQGIWPAIWMLPTDNVYGIWPKSGEIDIMEYLGHEPEKVLGTIHYGHDFWRFNSQEFELDTSTFDEDFHVFSVLWTEECIQFMVDGQKYGVPNTRSTTLPTTYPFDQDFHLILNMAIGGNLPGNPDATTIFPQTFEVDYVRVYQPK